MQLRTTSTHRTYRYLRLGMAGAVLAIGIAVAAQVAAGVPLSSVSAAFYTPARTVFVGGLCAVSLALLALSGRSLEQSALDLAALLAPLIAIVPVPVTAEELPGHPPCPGGGSCVPAAAVPEVALGMLTWSAMGAVVVVAALILGRVQRTIGPGLWGTVAAAAVVITGMTSWWLLAPGSFVASGHLVATVGFFGLVAAVATLAAVRPGGAGRRRARLRVAYIVIAAGIAVSLAFLIVVGLLPPVPGSVLFVVGESAVLLLFAAFWIVQTAEVWDDVDPSLRIRE